MGFIGRQPTPAPLTSSDIADGIVSKAKIANDAIDNTKLDLTDDYAFTGTITGAGQSLRANHKPIIINGDMQVAQRSTSVSSHNAVSYTTVDRFKTVCEVGTYTVAQENLSSGNAYLNGFKHALRLDCTTAEASAGSAGEQTTVEQRIEGFNLLPFFKGTSNAQPFTLAFWVKASKTGTNLQVNLRDNDNSRQVGGTYSISSADTWEKKVINYPADTTGAFDNDADASLTIEWFLDGGSNYSGGAVDTTWGANDNTDRNVTNFDLAGNTANDWAITGVQLEVGTYTSSTIPSFQFETYQENLSRCQRYFEICEGGKQFYNATSHQPRVNVDFRQQKRGSPTLTNISTNENCANGIQYSTGQIDATLCARVNAVNAFVTGEKFFYGKFSADAEI